MEQPHLSGYQERDQEIVDYRMGKLNDTGLYFRDIGDSKLPEEYFACIGAAQTYGCFCKQPYPTLVSNTINLPVLNLGYGGAGPEFFLHQQKLLSILNNAKFVIVQVMSGRSQSNSYYSCGGLEYVTLRQTGRKMGAGSAFDLILEQPTLLDKLWAPSTLKKSQKIVRNYLKMQPLIAEIRANYLSSFNELLKSIEVPKILFWFSKRTPNYKPTYLGTRRLLGEFPHLINKKMIDQLKSPTVEYVECVTSRGSPQPLISRFTGLPTHVDTRMDREDLGGDVWRENLYYPSPEMHQDASTAILDSCLLSNI